jgi:signal transduction histidine kinase/ligand-binding sensor domain-containing protein
MLNSALRFFTVIVFLLLGVHSEGQTLGNSLRFFTNFSSQNGFPAQEVYSFASDTQGMVWIGTNTGLYRFDGLRFMNFNHLLSNLTQAQYNLVTATASDEQGNIWVSYENVIACISESGKRVKNYTHNATQISSAPPHTAFRLFADPKGHIWSCNGSNVLSKHDVKSGLFKHFRPNANDASAFNIRDFYYVSDTLVWLVARFELGRFNPQTGTLHRFPILRNEVPQSPVLLTRICPDPSNKSILWLGSWGRGLIRFDIRSNQTNFFEYESGLPANISNIVFDLAVFNKNTLWVGGRGLLEFDVQTSKFRQHKHDPMRKSSLVVDEVRSLFKDKQGNFWVGTADGISLHSPEDAMLSLHQMPNGIPASSIFYDRHRKRLYLANYYAGRHLYIFDKNLQLIAKHPLPEADKYFSEPFGLCTDSRGNVWIGTTNSGLWKFSPESNRFSKIANSDGSCDIQNLNTSAMYCDASDIIWIASLTQGLLCCNANNPILKAVPQIRNRIEDISAGNDGTLWLREGRQALHQFDTKTGSHRVFGKTNAQNETNIKSISDVCAGPGNSMLIATLHNGILELKNNTIFKIKGLEKMRNIHSIAYDARGFYWMLGPTQLFRFEPITQKLETYSAEDGISGNLNASTLMQFVSDEIWFRGHEGIFALKTNTNRAAKSNHRLLLNSIKNNDLELLTEQGANPIGLKLAHDQNYLSFEFQAIEFVAPHKLNYAYKLDGLDENWVQSGNRRIAAYQAIPPGKYIFRVKLTDGSNTWSSRELRFPIEIVPAWYQTTWFKWISILMALLAIGLLFRYYTTRKLRNRLRQLEHLNEIQEIRNRIARDIHDEIGSGLSKIALLSSGMERKLSEQEELSKTNRRIKQLSSEVIQNMGEIIWAVNPGNDSVSSLFAYLRNYLNHFAEETQLSVQIELQSENPEIQNQQLRPELKRNLLLILKEALNNIQKHAQASEVRVVCKFTHSQISLLIRDNGRGFVREPRFNHGNGMKNMQKRATDLQGILDISFDSGTVIKLEFPWKQ